MQERRTEERREEGRQERVDATAGREATGRDGGKGRRERASEHVRSWRTSSDFSAVAAASERAALLCTSSLMASLVQPWLGSVLYHTTGRVSPSGIPVPSCSLSLSLSLLFFLRSSALLRAPRSTLSLFLFLLFSSLYLGPSPLPLPVSPVA